MMSNLGIVGAWAAVGAVLLAMQPESDDAFFERTINTSGYHYTLRDADCRAFAVNPDGAGPTRLLLTAGHCVDHLAPRAVVRVSRNVAAAAIDTCLVAFTTRPGRDIAMLALPAKNATSAAYLLRTAAVDTVGATVHYLKTNTGVPQKGTGTNETAVAGNFFFVKPLNGSHNLVPHDSGGPATINKRAAGIVSADAPGGASYKFTSLPASLGWIGKNWPPNPAVCP